MKMEGKGIGTEGSHGKYDGRVNRQRRGKGNKLKERERRRKEGGKGRGKDKGNGREEEREKEKVRGKREGMKEVRREEGKREEG